ncbi:MAG: B12-binding domain-containing radical SAM protein [Negativicutes bacterium]|nr:B12-binding domain-containing radical SAM protein [Negativicutes bacterium]
MMTRKKNAQSGERGSIIKHGDFLTWGICYPGPRPAANGSLGWQVIYREIAALDAWRCERFFYDRHWQDATGRLRGVDSGRPAGDCQILAVSLYYENDYFAVLAMLRDMGIPWRRSQRSAEFPLLLAGGPCASANPLPLQQVFDGFVVGEGEEVCRQLAEVYQRAAGRQAGREELLAEWAELASVYVPDYSRRPARRATVTDLDRYDGGAVFYGGESVFDDMFLLEIARGCGRGCGFCLAGSIYRPPRFRRRQGLLAAARRAVGVCSRVGLVGTAVADHPQLKDLIADLLTIGLESSPASLRADRVDGELAGLLRRCRLNTLTIAPEAGSPRLRAAINKGLDEEQILAAAEVAATAGFSRLRFYFMVGLPGEEEEDITAIVRLMAMVRRLTGRRTALVASVNPFVPKPFTQLAGAGMFPAGYYQRVKRRLAAELRRQAGCQLTAWPGTHHFFAQALLANGDEQVGEALLQAAAGRERGFGGLKRNLAAMGIDWQEYLSGRQSNRLGQIIDG